MTRRDPLVLNGRKDDSASISSLSQLSEARAASSEGSATVSGQTGTPSHKPKGDASHSPLKVHLAQAADRRRLHPLQELWNCFP